MSALRHRMALVVKRVFYGRRGEPYRIGGHTLRYAPGTRPVRLSYVHSANEVARYDALQLQLLATHLSDGDVAIDIGAHAGQYTVLMAARCGSNGLVVAFEPDPYARQQLRENLRLNPDLKPPLVEAIAVSDATGEATLFSRGGNAQSSLTRAGAGFRPGNEPEEIPVPTVRLDDYLRERGIPEPRWVKIDAEGAEIRILQGAKRLLAGASGILCELHPYAWVEFGNSLAELKELAAASGRRIHYLDEQAEIGDVAAYGTVLLERL